MDSRIPNWDKRLNFQGSKVKRHREFMSFNKSCPVSSLLSQTFLEAAGIRYLPLLRQRRLSALLRQHGDNIFHVYVFLNCAATHCHQSSYPWTIRRNQRAADCDRVRIPSYITQTRPVPGQDYYRAFTRCLWNYQSHSCVQTCWKQ
jgi:hypothetical protein